jgi:transcriptional regulator with XRE-family HTH domain
VVARIRALPGGARVGPGEAMIQDAVGKAIRELRTERGIMQNELARAADLEPALLSHIVNGRGNPAWGTRVRISTGLGVPLSELLARAEQLDQGG